MPVTQINEVILEGVEAYQHDAVLHDETPADHVRTMRALLQRPRKRKLKLSPPTATIATTSLGTVIGPTITAADISGLSQTKHLHSRPCQC